MVIINGEYRPAENNFRQDHFLSLPSPTLHPHTSDKDLIFGPRFDETSGEEEGKRNKPWNWV